MIISKLYLQYNLTLAFHYRGLQELELLSVPMFHMRLVLNKQLHIAYIQLHCQLKSRLVQMCSKNGLAVTSDSMPGTSHEGLNGVDGGYLM